MKNNLNAIIDILEKLKSNTYNFSNYHIFLIHEKKYTPPKYQTIHTVTKKKYKYT